MTQPGDVSFFIGKNEFPGKINQLQGVFIDSLKPPVYKGLRES
jgi:hypothetical protein